MTPAAIARRVVTWYRRHRRDLPWRRQSDPYATWVSEIMLQQTRVAVVIDYYQRWLARFPSVAALAEAELEDVLGMWSGLGYYSRARNLHRGAREVVARWGGVLPRTAAELRSIPGIGEYTAGAIASIAYGEREALVDGNVARVLARLYALELDVTSTAGKRELWRLARELVPANAAGDFNQGLMELGATVCTPGKPSCTPCPLADGCAARAQGRAEELPRRPRRRRPDEKPLLEAAAVLCVSDERVLLARRPPSGLYGGLWELPQAPDRKELATRFSGWLRLMRAKTPAHRHEQELTHRRLAIEVWRGRAVQAEPAAPAPYTSVAWHALADLGEVGLSSATRTIVRELT